MVSASALPILSPIVLGQGGVSKQLGRYLTAG